MFAAIIYAEAGGEGELCMRAIAHCIMNRVGRYEWKDRKSVTAVVTQPGHYTGYNNDMYKYAMNYYKYGSYNNLIDKRAMDTCLDVAKRVYTGKDKDISKDAVFFYSPSCPGDEFPFAYAYEQVYIDGISSDVFLFYRCYQ